MATLLSGKYPFVTIIYTPNGFLISELERINAVKVLCREVKRTYKGQAFMVCVMKDIRGRVTKERYVQMFKKFKTPSNLYALDRAAIYQIFEDWRAMYQGGYIVSEMFNLVEGENAYNPIILPGRHPDFDVRRIYLKYMDRRIECSLGRGYGRFKPKLDFTAV